MMWFATYSAVAFLPGFGDAQRPLLVMLTLGVFFRPAFCTLTQGWPQWAQPEGIEVFFILEQRCGYLQ